MTTTTLMMTYVVGQLPNPEQLAWMCSAGSQGYCAVKETLQNGVPGCALLIESGDLRAVEGFSKDCCFIYSCSRSVTHNYSKHISGTVEHLTLYSNSACIPYSLLPLGCTGLTTLDLSPLSRVTVVQNSFLQGCSGLTALDLSPLSRVTEVQSSFLLGCAGLTALDLRPLSRVTEVQSSFLEECIAVDNVLRPPLCPPPSGWAVCDTNKWVRV